jgi:DNA-binding response OmpR family regulator
MEASIDHDSPFVESGPGRFTRVGVQTKAGEIEARLSEKGNWELRVRRDENLAWRLACSGNLECGSVATEPPPAPDEPLQIGPLTIEPAAHRVRVNGVEVPLSAKEFALLLAMSANPDQVFTREELLMGVWGHGVEAKTRTLDSHASRLRLKLRDAGAGEFVINVKAVGFKLRPHDPQLAVPKIRRQRRVSAAGIAWR